MYVHTYMNCNAYVNVAWWAVCVPVEWCVYCDVYGNVNTTVRECISILRSQEVRREAGEDERHVGKGEG